MLRNGARGYLTKNTEPEELLRAAQTVMNDEIYLTPAVAEKWKISPAYLTGPNKKKYKTNLMNDREYEFLSYCATDMGYKEIAEEMGVQYKTIDSYRASVTEKLNIHTRSGLAAYAIKYGLARKDQA
jgi:two-component system invasion response regulator UvrY